MKVIESYKEMESSHFENMLFYVFSMAYKCHEIAQYCAERGIKHQSINKSINFFVKV